MKKFLNILQVNTSDAGGGAERIAYNMHRTYRAQGHTVLLAVGNRRTNDLDVVAISDYAENVWQRCFFTIGDLFSQRGDGGLNSGRIRHWLRLIGHYKRLWEILQGHEKFEFPGTKQIIGLSSRKPDIIHCHNLHGSYFDLRELSLLSQQVPVVLTLHDSWLLSGHCAHSFDCALWETGCGNCPDLTIYPQIRRDATAYNWRRKQQIYAKSRLYVTTPSKWLMQKVEKSNLKQGIAKARIIPNGVDLAVFNPVDKRNVRTVLGIPPDVKVLLFAANGIRQNIWKDYKTLRASVSLIADRLPEQKILFIALGEESSPEHIGHAEIRFIPYQGDPASIAGYYQAADLYIHAAKADTFPNTILEALACGTPVVATAVGGIPEQVVDGITGFLVPPGDAAAIAAAIVKICLDDNLLIRLGRSAADDARQRFGLNRQIDEMMNFYTEVREDWLTWKSNPLHNNH